MHYVVSVISDGTEVDPPETMAEIGAYNERLQAAGQLFYANGLAAPETATVVDHRDGETIVTDGPFLESKEYLAGFWIIDVPDLDVALRLAAEGSRVCRRRVEVRPTAGP